MIRTLKPVDFSKTDFERNKALIIEALGYERITDLPRCVFRITVPEKPDEIERRDQVHHTAVYVPSAPGMWASAAFLNYLCKLEAQTGSRYGQRGEVEMRGDYAALAAAYFATFEGAAPGEHPTIDALRKTGALVNTLVIPDASRENRIRNFYGEWANLGKDARHLAMLESAEMLMLLEHGAEHSAEPSGSEWLVRKHVKEAILLYFRSHENQVMKEFGIAYDKVPLLAAHWHESEFPLRGFRLVPGSTVRAGAHIGRGAVVMTNGFVNIGGFVGEDVMVDTGATVGSCAIVGKKVHLSGGAGLGGVLEPVNATPVVVEDEAFIGARSEVVEGVIVRKRAVLSMGVFIGKNTPIIDQVNGNKELHGEVPENAVVMMGVHPKNGLICPIIRKYRDAKTNAALALEEALRG